MADLKTPPPDMSADQVNKLLTAIRNDPMKQFDPDSRKLYDYLKKTDVSKLSVTELGIRGQINEAFTDAVKNYKWPANTPDYVKKTQPDALKVFQRDADKDQANVLKETTQRAQAGDAEAQKAVTNLKTTGTTTTNPNQPNSGPNFGNQTDPLASFSPVFINDQDIENLARTGQFDITPQSIAKMFPTAEYQKAVATAKAEGGPDPTTILDELSPAQYNDASFVHVGQLPDNLSPDPTAAAIAQIKAQGLPAWEEGRMIDQVNKQASVGHAMTQDEYEQKLKEIKDEGLPASLEGKRIQDLRDQFNATKQATPGDVMNTMANNQAGNSSLKDVVGKPYSWTADQVAATATELFKAGYLQINNYDPNKALSQQMHITSPYDPSFQKAYLAWVSDSFKDRSKSMMDILKQNQESFLPQLKQLADQVAASKPKLVVNLTDSQGIRQNAESLAQQVAGFKLGDDEYQQLISYIHGLQTQSQTAAYNAQYGTGSTGGTVQDVDVNAQLEAAIRANHPVEAAGKDVADEADLMRSLFAGPGH